MCVFAYMFIYHFACSFVCVCIVYLLFVFVFALLVPCISAPGVIGSALGLVGPVSVYCDWVR